MIVSASTVHAASETHTVVSSADNSEEEAVSPPPSTQPVVIVITVLVFVLFGIIAIFPLLFDDPVKVYQEANQGKK